MRLYLFFTVLCLLGCLLLQAQQGVSYQLKTQISKKEVKAFLKKYREMPDTLPNANVYETVTEHRMPDRTEYVEILPNVMDTVNEQVLIKEAYSGYRTPVYQTVRFDVLTVEPYKELEIIPTVYDTVIDKLLIARAEPIWVKNKAYKGDITPQCYDPKVQMDTCLWYKGERAARYQNIPRRVVKTPATTRATEIPAQYTTLQKQVIDSVATAKNPLQTKRIDIAAEYKTVKKMIVKTPPTLYEIAYSPDYSTITTKILVETKFSSEPTIYNPPYFIISESVKNRNTDTPAQPK